MLITTLLIFLQTVFFQSSYNAPCNTFPKVLGADTGDTFLHQFDVFGDFMVLAGDTSENKLTGTTSKLPYVALMSIQAV